MFSSTLLGAGKLLDQLIRFLEYVYVNRGRKRKPVGGNVCFTQCAKLSCPDSGVLEAWHTSFVNKLFVTTVSRNACCKQYYNMSKNDIPTKIMRVGTQVFFHHDHTGFEQECIM